MKNLKITVNGIEYKVKVEEIDEQESLKESNINLNKKEIVSDKAEQSNNKNNQDSTGEPINAPMPGTIVAVKVSQGQSVSKGDVLLVLEAMKMENEIMAPRDAVIAGVNVKKGDSAEAGVPLIFLK